MQKFQQYRNKKSSSQLCMLPLDCIT